MTGFDQPNTAPTAERPRCAEHDQFVPCQRPGCSLGDVPARDTEAGKRRIKLTPASAITARAVHWVWQDRLPLGSLTLLAGREGIGKSTVAYNRVADITRGRLVGCFHGTPKSVLVAATEDSWSHTIIPRLMAAGADMDRVYRIDVETAEGFEGTLTLPSDTSSLGEIIDAHDIGYILLDPLMSRLDGGLDSHKDSAVRQALEPLVKLADEHRVLIEGIIHVNKSTGSDPLTRIMGSRAFTAVPRAILYVMVSPENEDIRLLGQAKNNLGRSDLPTLMFAIESAYVATDNDGEAIYTGKVKWLGESDQSITDALSDADSGEDSRTAVGEAGEWLESHLRASGGVDESSSIKSAGQKAGHSYDALKRARKRLKITFSSSGFPRKTWWTLPGTQPVDQSERVPLETPPTAPTALTCSD